VVSLRPFDKLRAFGFTTGYQLPSLWLDRTPRAEMHFNPDFPNELHSYQSLDIMEPA
jgi:hypothetical protein